MVLPIFSGLIIQKYGLHSVLLVTSFLITIGQTILCFGAFSKSFYFMMAGRTIIGFGSETLFVAAAVCTSKWFYDSEASFAFGVYLGVSNLSESISGVIVPYFETVSNMGVAFGFGAALCIISSISAISFVQIDLKR